MKKRKKENVSEVKHDLGKKRKEEDREERDNMYAVGNYKIWIVQITNLSLSYSNWSKNVFGSQYMHFMKIVMCYAGN